MAKCLHLTAVIWREGKQYVSRCPEIGVASYGKTPTAAREALQEAVELWVSNARKLGILDDIRPSLEKEERYTAPLEVAV
ncbi:MAG: type II toxin-antitoxin system HicB family antitoxin [Planctomycetes bacterium]|nr:type II toxin-antitoxin system HicB family antitoxin [Planctomycetota bacterium]